MTFAQAIRYLLGQCRGLLTDARDLPLNILLSLVGLGRSLLTEPQLQLMAGFAGLLAGFTSPWIGVATFMGMYSVMLFVKNQITSILTSRLPFDNK